MEPHVADINATGGNSLAYNYDGDHARIKEIATAANGTTTTLYVGASTFEPPTPPAMRAPPRWALTLGDSGAKPREPTASRNH